MPLRKQSKLKKAVQMSAYGGDKSRFHRLRKQKLLKRAIKAKVLAAKAATAAPVVETKSA